MFMMFINVYYYLLFVYSVIPFIFHHFCVFHDPEAEISPDPHTTFGALDFGGASMQIAFVPHETSILAGIFPMHFGGSVQGPIHLYSHRPGWRGFIQDGQDGLSGKVEECWRFEAFWRYRNVFWVDNMWIITLSHIVSYCHISEITYGHAWLSKCLPWLFEVKKNMEWLPDPTLTKALQSLRSYVSTGLKQHLSEDQKIIKDLIPTTGDIWWSFYIFLHHFPTCVAMRRSFNGFGKVVAFQRATRVLLLASQTVQSCDRDRDRDQPYLESLGNYIYTYYIHDIYMTIRSNQYKYNINIIRCNWCSTTIFSKYSWTLLLIFKTIEPVACPL